MTEYDLHPTQSLLYVHNNLKWRISIDANLPLHGRVTSNTIVILHRHSTMAYSQWGIPLTGLSAVTYNEMATSPTTDLINVQFPCQSACSIFIASNTSSTYLAVSCDILRPGSMVWYELTCSITNITACSEFKVTDAVLTSDKLLLITSRGLLTSECGIASNCGFQLWYHKFSSLNAYDLDWSTAKFSSSPICASLDHLLYKNELILVTVTSNTGKKMIFGSKHPFETWKLYLEKPSSYRKLAATFDRQAGNIITIVSKPNENPYSQAYSIRDDDRNSTLYRRFPSFHFDSPRDDAVHTLLLSNRHYFVTIGSSLWTSIDGGNFFTKLKDFNSNETVMQLSGYEIYKSFLCTTSQGRVFWGQVGVPQIRLITENVSVSSSLVMFNHAGDIIVAEPNATASSPISFKRFAVRQKPNELCRYELKVEPELFLFNMLEVKHTLKYGVIVSIRDITNTEFLTHFGLAVNFGHATNFRTFVHPHKLDQRKQMVKIKIKTMFLLQTVTSISVYLNNLNETCPMTSHTVIVVAGCPTFEQLVFNYSSFFIRGFPLNISEYTSEDQSASRNLLITLPVNHRPPSSLAVGIPQSSNVYNVDPAVNNSTQLLNYHFATKAKQKGFCVGAKTKSECSCTPALKFSSLEKHSDCREKVYGVLYDFSYPIRLSIVESKEHPATNENYDLRKLYVYMEEVNGRDASVYAIKDNSETTCDTFPDNLICRANQLEENGSMKPLLRHMTSGRSNRVYNASTLSIKFLGKGLFHFRITVVSGFSFCVLQDEFQVFVVNAPLAFPTGIIIRLTVSVAMGAVMILMYTKFLFSSSFADFVKGTPSIEDYKASDAPSKTEPPTSATEVHPPDEAKATKTHSHLAVPRESEVQRERIKEIIRSKASLATIM